MIPSWDTCKIRIPNIPVVEGRGWFNVERKISRITAIISLSIKFITFIYGKRVADKSPFVPRLVIPTASHLGWLFTVITTCLPRLLLPFKTRIQLIKVTFEKIVFNVAVLLTLTRSRYGSSDQMNCKTGRITQSSYRIVWINVRIFCRLSDGNLSNIMDQQMAYACTLSYRWTSDIKHADTGGILPHPPSRQILVVNLCQSGSWYHKTDTLSNVTL